MTPASVQSASSACAPAEALTTASASSCGRVRTPVRPSPATVPNLPSALSLQSAPHRSSVRRLPQRSKPLAPSGTPETPMSSHESTRTRIPLPATPTHTDLPHPSPSNWTARVASPMGKWKRFAGPSFAKPSGPRSKPRKLPGSSLLRHWARVSSSPVRCSRSRIMTDTWKVRSPGKC